MKQLRECMTRDELALELGTKVASAWDTNLNNASEELTKEIKEEGFMILSDLDKQIKEYFDKKALIDKLSEELKVQNKAIVNLLTNDYATKKYEGNGYSAAVSYKETIKYNDEQALVTLLKQDDNLKSYIVEAINTKGLNELIKNSESVAEKLNGKYTKTTSSSLTIKKI